MELHIPMRVRFNNYRGDTIVEVMIALAVLMVIIAGGYSIATRSLNGTRVAQERSEATKIAEGQLEAINQRLSKVKSLSELETGPQGKFIGYDGSWAASGIPGSYPASGFCVKDDGVAEPLGASPGNDPDCVFLGLYRVYITTGVERLHYTNVASTDKKQLSYRINVEWDRSGGGQKERVELVSRYVVQ